VKSIELFENSVFCAKTTKDQKEGLFRSTLLAQPKSKLLD
jgi:hypothetical protein